MSQPSPGALLRGLRASLKDAVLPALAEGEAARQMRAALHLLGRLERVWDLYPSHLEADNADIEAVLAAVIMRLDIEGAGRALAGPIARLRTQPDEIRETQGFNDPALRRQVSRNAVLRDILGEIDAGLGDLHDLPSATRRQCLDDLFGLYRRMNLRDRVLVGDLPIDAAGGATPQARS
jgi:hypothetical protein